MCTLAVFVGTLPGHPLALAANRDELLARPARPPELLRETPPRAFGGRDLVARGTWLGINERGLVAGVLNRMGDAPRDPTLRSRGQLCLDLLACDSAVVAAARLAAEPPGRYNPFNLLVADAREAFVATQVPGGPSRVLRLDRGLHLLTNLDVDDPRCPRIASSHQGFAGAGDAFVRDGDVAALVDRLQARLADHAIALDPRGPGNLCVHGDGYGTRSATVILLPADGASPRYFHADGPPCRTRLAPVSVPF